MQTRTPEIGETPEGKPVPTSGGQGVGAPGSPGAGEAPTIWVKKVCREFYYRNTGFGGFTGTIVILDGEVLEPSRTRRTRSGNHGEDYYCLTESEWGRAWVIELRQSNSGRRDVAFENVPEPVRELLERAWLFEDTDVTDIAEMAAKFYRLYVRGEVSG